MKGDELERALGAPAPRALSGLAADDRAHLAAAIGATQRRQRDQLAIAGDRALDQIPWPLRGVVRKLVGG